MKTKKKICYNCRKQSSNLKNGVVSRKVASWKKILGLKTKLPGDINLPLKINYPKKYNTTFKLDLSKKYANRFIYYYGAKKNDSNCLESKYVIDAYGKDFSNKGVTKCDKNGQAIIKIDCPQSYYVNDINKQYVSHIHYLISDSNNKEWGKKLYTETIICDIDKNKLKQIIKNQCAIIINALPYEEFMKDRIPNSIPV